MVHSSDDKAVCRGCGLELRGKPYHMGGNAYHPQTGARCPANFYGGYVCSESCDRRASLEQEQSMPGNAGRTTKFLSSPAKQRIHDNWTSHE